MATAIDTGTLANLRQMICRIADENSSTKELDFVRKAKPGELNVERIGSHGYMNDIWRIFVSGKDGDEVVVKQAFPYMKRLGESHPTPQGRLLIEYNSLKKMQAICPMNVVTPYCYSAEHKAFVMQYMPCYENMKTRLIQGQVDKVSIDYLAKSLGMIHRDTSGSSMDGSAFVDLQKEFDNREMCDIMENYIFRKTFDKNDRDNLIKPQLANQVEKLYEDQGLLQDVAYYRRLYRQKQECLIHGDLHTGSIMIPLAKEEDHPKMFDTEFSCVGPAAFDVGFLLAHFFMAYYQHELTEENNDLHRQVMNKILEASRKFLETYLDNRGQLSGTYVSEFYQEVAGFAACEIFFRVIGCGSSENISHSANMEQAALNCGLRLMRQHQIITNDGKLMMIGLQLC